MSLVEEIMRSDGHLSKRKVIIFQFCQCPALPVSVRWDRLPSLPYTGISKSDLGVNQTGISTKYLVSNH